MNVMDLSRIYLNKKRKLWLTKNKKINYFLRTYLQKKIYRVHFI